MYPRFKLDWGGETQLAHSHALQIFAESGIFAAFAWLFWWIGWAFPGKFKNMPKGALIGVTGFLLHGLMDFDFFIPGITIQAIFLLAVLWASISVPVQRTLRLSAIGRWSYAFILAIVLVILPYRYFQRSALGMGYFSQGLALAEQADWIEARKSLDQAVSCQPNLPSYHFYRGLILEREGDREGALQSYRQASTLAPSVAYYYYRVGLLTSASNPFAALSALREAQRNNPGNPEYALAIKKLEKLNGQGLGALIK